MCAATIAYGMEAIAGKPDRARHRRNGHRQHHRGRGALCRALWRQRRRLGRPRHRRRRCRACAARPTRSIGRSRCIGDGADRSAGDPRPAGRPRDRRHARARSSRRGTRRSRCSSTASSRPPRRRLPTRSIRDAIDHCIFAHVSAEHAHRQALERMGVTPMLDLGMRLGEGSGAALGMVLAKTALHLHSNMATFDSAGVSGKA